jgi:UDP-N-acetylmuramoyl-L-alanyl-D-glutamate--2,6-diaminopimelate ligase
MEIIADIEKYMGNAPYVSIPDRKEAIEYAVSHAEEGDIVLLAGKGHEKYQLINGKKEPFCERDILLAAAEKLMMSNASNV